MLRCRSSMLRRVCPGLLVLAFVSFHAMHVQGECTHNIMLTGYWSPTNEMLAQFSTTDETLNPTGWQGGNWQGLGYDVYSYYPTFESPSDYQGTGDCEVDYQDTYADFWRIVEEIHPVAILSYGVGAGPWELEYNAVKWDTWSDDYEAPYQPDPSTLTGPDLLTSTLPVEEIADAITDSGIGIYARVDKNGDPGDFLCDYMAYQVSYYQSLHADASDPYQCLAAGFTHVNATLSLSRTTAASEIALRTTIDYLNTVMVPEPSTLALAAVGMLGLLAYCRRKTISNRLGLE